MNDTFGKHLVIELTTKDSSLLNNKDKLVSLFHKYIKICGATLIDEKIYQFQPIGLSGVFLLAESHMSFHTWPEKGYASVDFYTCGDTDPQRMLSQMSKDFQCQLHGLYIHRGLKPNNCESKCDEDRECSRFYSNLQWHRDLS